MYSTEYTITKDDLDIYQHVNHAQYLSIFVQCRWAFAKEIGYDQDYVMKEKRDL